MRKICFFLLVTLLAAIPANAQKQQKDRENMRKEITEFKMKFIAQEIELKDDQQKQFFDLYAQMTAERMKLLKEKKALEKKLEKANATDEEYEEVVAALSVAKDKEAEIEKKYDEKFSKFLSSKQIFKMKAAEGKFNDKMHEMRHKKRGEKK